MKTKTPAKLVPAAAIGAVAAALLIGPGAVASSQVKTLRGICNLEGTSSVNTYSFGSSHERTVSRGTCLASVNGDSLQARRVQLVTKMNRPLIDLRSSGTGWIRVEGYKRRLEFRFQRLAARALMITGANGSRAHATIHRRGGGRHLLVLESGGQLRGM